MLVARNVCKTYKKKRRVGILKWEKEDKVAIDGVSIKIESGKIIGVLGENGAGKTTLIKMLTTLLNPTSGEIFINGNDTQKNIKETREMINMITGGERNIYWRLTPIENLKYFGALYNVHKSILMNRIEILLKKVGLWEERNTPVEQFSKGMKQRLQIAKGLINDPQYIFLDEPTLGLDTSISKDLRLYIKRLAKEENKGILLTTHYMEEAEELCDYIYILDKGKLLLEGTREMIFDQLKLKKNVFITFSTDNQTGLWQQLTNLGLDFKLEEQFLIIEMGDLNLLDITEKVKQLPMQIMSIEINVPKLTDVLLLVKGA